MMKFALFIGCNIPARVQHYELSARAVLDKLSVDIIDIREFNCCGYPIRNADSKAFLLFSARNLALAEKRSLNVMTLCKCCFGSLKKADHLIKDDSSVRDEINAILAKEGLVYKGSIEVKHFLSVLHKDIGLETINKKITRSFKDLKVAVHYGCHALRPSDVMQFDNPVAPVLFDQLLEITGAKSIEWPLKLECCGAPLLGVNDDLSMDLTEKKLAAGIQSGADYLCTACPWCQLQFDSVQKIINIKRGSNHLLPSIVFPQILGIAMGIKEKDLGVDMNQIDIRGFEGFLT
jgi:heterodisulfide reductase subunit B